MLRNRSITFASDPDDVTGLGPLKSANVGSLWPGFCDLTTEYNGCSRVLRKIENVAVSAWAVDCVISPIPLYYAHAVRG
ncbi:MAG: hypothetical protein CMM47_11340 [Rhodospirillaceae bacterium]|nr:hypothetical protein [Rhodospirillaceae bacterium]